MSRISIHYAFAFTCVITINMIPFNSASNLTNIERKLDLAFQSAPMKSVITWYGLGVPFENNDSDDLYLPDYWAIFISSNETLLKSENGTCLHFKDFICEQPSCSEDSSTLYSQNYTKISIFEATRLSTQDILIAKGAWKLSSPALYIQNCIGPASTDIPAIGQIGLGLSGNAYKNFQTSTFPLFSIVFHSLISAELIFGFNSSYVNDTSSGITLPCDLDWKIQVHSMSIGDTIISSVPVSMIFDLQTSGLTFPSSYFYNLKPYFLNLSQCNQHRDDGLSCFYCGDLLLLPIFIFVLEDGTRFSLSPESYMLQSGTECYQSQFALKDNTLSGVNYITLGREAMSKHYILFEQISNETAEITLYSHPLINTASEPDLLFGASTDTEDSPLRNNIDTRTNISQETHELPASSSEENMSIPQEENIDSKSDHTFLYVIICTIMAVVIFALIIWKFNAKKERLPDNKRREWRRSTVEMNESSYFVTTNQQSQDDDHNNGTENDCSE